MVKSFRAFNIFRLGAASVVPAGEGENKGMYEDYVAKEGALEFYGSRKWKRCRKNYLSLHPICERCEKLGVVNRAEIVHHKIYLDTSTYKDPELSLNFDNLEALCFNCHQAEHHKNHDCRDELFFDAAGNLRKG